MLGLLKADGCLQFRAPSMCRLVPRTFRLRFFTHSAKFFPDMSTVNSFGAEAVLSTSAGQVRYFRLRKLVEDGIGHIETLPYSIRVLLEACLRNVDNFIVTADDVVNLANWNAAKPVEVEVPFKPGRVVLQDFTGVPAVVDLAALRSAMVRMGGEEDQSAGALRSGD
jgi:aconitase A